MIPEELQALQQYLKVVHHVPGRIRIKFAADLIRHLKSRGLIPNGLALPGAAFRGDLLDYFTRQGLLESPQALEGVHSMRLNPGARSIIIEYDPVRWQPPWVEELLSTADAGRFQAMLEELAVPF